MCYVIGDRQLPLYFKRLQWDLYEATDFEEWFVEYLRHHPALSASIPRKNLIENIECLFKTFKMVRNRNFDFVLNSKPAHSFDWRDNAKKSAILNDVLFFVDKDKANVPELPWTNYGKSISSLLVFHRNSLKHPEGRLITNGDEMELLLAVVFEDFLPELIGCLLRLCGMQDEYVLPSASFCL